MLPLNCCRGRSAQQRKLCHPSISTRMQPSPSDSSSAHPLGRMTPACTRFFRSQAVLLARYMWKLKPTEHSWSWMAAHADVSDLLCLFPIVQKAMWVQQERPTSQWDMLMILMKQFGELETVINCKIIGVTHMPCMLLFCSPETILHTIGRQVYPPKYLHLNVQSHARRACLFALQSPSREAQSSTLTTSACTIAYPYHRHACSFPLRTPCLLNLSCTG